MLATVVSAVISIHALREESDSTVRQLDAEIHISIHALREESDRVRRDQIVDFLDFNPRSP